MNGRYHDQHPHLWSSPPKGRRGGSARVTRDNEGRCTVCGARVTIDTSNGDEYGHAPGCAHRPEKFGRLKEWNSENMISDHVCPECGRGDFVSESGLKSHHTIAHGESITDTADCPGCGHEFEPNRSNQVYCSRECYVDAISSEMVDVTCRHCDDVFTVRQWEAQKRAFCSDECRHDHHHETVICEECDDVFEVVASYASNRRFCSQDCRYTAQEGSGDPHVTTTCPECGDEFERKAWRETVYCSRDCQIDSMRVTETRSCEECGGEFETNPADSKRFCSPACAQANGRDRITRNCPECGDEFETTPSEDGKYCSHACSQASQRNRIERTCEECGDEFETTPSDDKIYCSPACVQASQRDRSVNTCPVCGEVFETLPSREKTYCCRECYNNRGQVDATAGGSEGVAGD